MESAPQLWAWGGSWGGSRHINLPLAYQARNAYHTGMVNATNYGDFRA